VLTIASAIGAVAGVTAIGLSYQRPQLLTRL
jgi:hypothetical protein